MNMNILAVSAILVIGIPGSVIVAYVLSRGEQSGPLLQRHLRMISIIQTVVFGLSIVFLLAVDYALVSLLLCCVGMLGVWITLFTSKQNPDAAC